MLLFLLRGVKAETLLWGSNHSSPGGAMHASSNGRESLTLGQVLWGIFVVAIFVALMTGFSALFPKEARSQTPTATKYLQMGVDPVNPNRQPTADEFLVLIDQDICDSGWGSGSGKRVAGCYQKGSVAIVSKTTMTVNAMLGCGNDPQNKRLTVTGKIIELSPSKTAATSMPALAAKTDDMPKVGDSTSNATAGGTSGSPDAPPQQQIVRGEPCVDALAVLGEMRQKSRKKNASVQCSPEGDVKVTWDEFGRPTYAIVSDQSIYGGSYGYSGGWGVNTSGRVSGYGPVWGSSGVNTSGSGRVGGYGGSYGASGVNTNSARVGGYGKTGSSSGVNTGTATVGGAGSVGAPPVFNGGGSVGGAGTVGAPPVYNGGGSVTGQGAPVVSTGVNTGSGAPGVSSGGRPQ